MLLSLGAIMLGGYLLGSIPTSIWVGKLYKGVDIREHGSGNAGATNTFRLLGWKAGLIVSLIDLGKGFVSSYFIYKLAFIITGEVVTLPNWDLTTFVQLVAGLMAVVGHMFPLYAGFSGGKGVITAAGMLLAIEPAAILVVILVFIIVLFTSRYVSLASMLASLAYPITLLIMRIGLGWEIDGSLIIFGAVLAIGIVVKHHGNIKRLMEGNENRVRSFAPAKGWLNKEKQTENEAT